MDATLDTNFFFYFVSSVEHSCCLIKGSKVKDKVKVKGKEKKRKRREEKGEREGKKEEKEGRSFHFTIETCVLEISISKKIRCAAPPGGKPPDPPGPCRPG